MIASLTANHAEEVRSGKRFAFGKNWRSFLKQLTVPRIRMAEASLRDALGRDRLDDLTFLDIGSGSGLFSLAARRLGARVTSFDFDQNSVNCTALLRDRYFPGDSDWKVEQGSALDQSYLEQLGQFDIVYSWGVLHHTGDMWAALRKVTANVRVGGTLFISLYNDQGEATDRWEAIKRRYNSLPRGLSLAFAIGIIAREEGRELRRHLRRGTSGDWIRGWTEYDRLSSRGMSRWHDWIDWIGGLPYERVRIEPVVDLLAKDGFQLKHLVDRSSGYGCNEFVFDRIAPPGVAVESSLPNSASMGRRLGKRVHGPFERDESGWYGRVVQPVNAPLGASLFLIRDDVVEGTVQMEADGRVRIGSLTAREEDLKDSALYVIAAAHAALPKPYVRQRGKSFEARVTHLADWSDSEDAPNRSPVFVFEDGRQLPMPHAVHDEIAAFGSGRFSHWGGSMFFSSLDNSDPSINGRSYSVYWPPRAIPPDHSFGAGFGLLIAGPFFDGATGWTVSVDRPKLEADQEIFLVRDDEIVASAVWDEDGRLIVASPSADESSLADTQFWLVIAHNAALRRPFNHVRGMMWETGLPGWRSIADEPGRDQASTLFVFEDGRQLPYPHALHDDIAILGGGRFSHWESSLYLSSSDGSDPNANGRDYRAFVARRFDTIGPS